MDSTTSSDLVGTAARLSLVLGRLRGRLRDSATGRSGLTTTQLGVLRHLMERGADHGPATAADLAAADRVSQQAVAQTLAQLRERGLVGSRRHPEDGRKVIVEATAEGRSLYAAVLESREAWLVRAMEAELTGAERAKVREAVGLLERLAEADPSPRGRE